VSATLAICALGLLCAALLAALIYREHRHDAERAELLDRITVPEAATAGAFQRLGGVEPVIAMNTDEEDDKKYGVDLPFDSDLESLSYLSAQERELF